MNHTRPVLRVVRLVVAIAALSVSSLAAPPSHAADGDGTAGSRARASAQSVAAESPSRPAPTTSPAAPARHLFEATSRHPFEDVDYWKSVFDDPARDAWQKPHEVIAALGLHPGMSVADLGAGTGYFTHHLAPTVAPGGTVFAVETEPNLVTHLRARAEQDAQPNVVPVLASFDNPRLPPAAVDLVLVVDTFHHIDQRLAYFQRLSGVLRPGGRVAIIDWRIDQLPVGPPPDHKIAREQVLAEMQAAGYRLVDERPKLLPYHYFLVFQPG